MKLNLLSRMLNSLQSLLVTRKLFDVISPFTSIAIGMAIDVVQRKLEESDDWKNHTQLTKDQILDLLSFLPHNSYFVFEGAQYQVSGCAMGSPVSAAQSL